MRSQEIVDARNVQGLNLELMFGERKVNVSACVVGKKLKLLCDSFWVRNWLSENKDEVLSIVERSLGKLKGVEIYENSHK